MDGHAAHMAVAHDVRQLLQREISRTAARIKSIRAEVDRVGAVADGGVQRVERPGGR